MLEIRLNTQLSARPKAADFDVREAPRPEAFGDGQVLVRSIMMSLDPYLGMALQGKHYGSAPGDGPLPGRLVGEVIGSGSPDFAVGDHVVGQWGWAEYGVAAADTLRKVDSSVPLSLHLSVLGMPGLTAWAAMTQLAKVKAGDILTVDAAAGPVGATAGQIVRNLGGKAFGIAGGPEKCALVKDQYGFDDCIDYKREGWVEALKAACPEGPTVHLENVGMSVYGPILDMIQPFGRIVFSGLAEHYHGEPMAVPVGRFMGKRAVLMGVIVYDYEDRYDEWLDLAIPWVKAGTLTVAEDIAEGLAAAPAQFDKLMAGRNVGKTLVRLGPDRA